MADLVGNRCDPHCVVFVDPAERPQLVVLAASELDAVNGAAERLRVRSDSLGSPFALLVSDARVRILNGGATPLAELDLAELLARYHTEPSPWSRSPGYLLCLVEAWLSDLAYGWAGAPVPAAELLERIGLADRLRAGTACVVPDEQGSLRP